MCGEVAQRLQATAEVATRGLGGKYKKWLRALPTDVAAIIAIRECIRMCTSPETHIHIQDLTFNVGKLWELEVRIRQAEALNPLYMQKVHEQVKERATRDYGHLRRLYGVAVDRVFKGTLDLDITKAEMMQIGKFGVDACFEAGLIDMTRGHNKHGMTVAYVLNAEVLEFLRGYDRDDVRGIISKEDGRMLAPPDPWTNLSDGGYLSLRRKAAAPMMNVRRLRKSVRGNIAEGFTAEKMPEVFACGNYLQSIPFRVHGVTTKSILQLWQEGGGVMGVPDAKGPQKPAFPLPEDWVKEGASEKELAVFGQWKRRVAKHYDDLREWKGHVRELSAFLRTSKETSHAWWFPVYCDSRGRWYYRGIPNPQGSDLAKAVLHFDRKKPLTERGVFWLKVHIANSAGFDKERMQDRARWTEQNWKRIEAALDDPLNHPEVWGKDAPWCMFSAAWELREAYRSGNPATYCTGIPVHMDATCSGLQHFSAILRDPIGALYVNLTDPNQCGPKQDIYSRVGTVAIQMVQRDTESDNEELRTLAQWWLDTGITRDMAKKPVMTYVYGATLRGTADHIENLLIDAGVNWLDEDRTFEHCMYIAKKLFAGIEAAVPAAAAAMRWLQSIARQQPSGKRMTWHTPTGFHVQHDYQDFQDKVVHLRSCGVQETVVRDWLEGTRQHSMVNAISPNFVHALDSAHLTKVVNAMADEQRDIVVIHDSFGTHPCDVDAMHVHIREQFVDLYSGPNLLTEFLWEVQGAGEAPTRGTFDLREVLNSEFMFS